MTDRELLEAAAKAADYWDREFQCFEGPANWDPLVNDGDALRLAVKLELAVITAGPYSESYTMRSPEANRVEKHGDPYAATRRAIVRAAAEIGKEKA